VRANGTPTEALTPKQARSALVHNDGDEIDESDETLGRDRTGIRLTSSISSFSFNERSAVTIRFPTRTGHAPARWPLALVKERVDNGFDACERRPDSRLSRPLRPGADGARRVRGKLSWASIACAPGPSWP